MSAKIYIYYISKDWGVQVYSGIHLEVTREIVAVAKQTQLKMLDVDFSHRIILNSAASFQYLVPTVVQFQFQGKW